MVEVGGVWKELADEGGSYEEEDSGFDHNEVDDCESDDGSEV